MVAVHRVLRVSAVMSILAGLLHIAIPGRLLELASQGYERVLAVRFQPQESATARVRLIGLAMLVSGPILLRCAAYVRS